MEREESREVPLPPAAQLHALLQPHTQAEADVSPSLQSHDSCSGPSSSVLCLLADGLGRSSSRL